MDTFTECQEVSALLEGGDEFGARERLIKLLDGIEDENGYTPVLNHLIREVGLYPYIQPTSARWEDRFTFEAFKIDVGGGRRVALHREQSAILRRLLNGESLVVSAPTSFGKSFIIDAFIALRKPANVVIIVPTIALTDETRRRLQKKYGATYRFITTSEAELGEKNIMIFPQERALHYADLLEKIDILIIDEFYKAGVNYDKERSPALIKALLKFQKKANQRYYLAPNIAELRDSLFTNGMKFVPVDFTTVFLEKHELYKEIGTDEARKGAELVRILKAASGKTLIYAGTYSNIDKVCNVVRDHFEELANKRLNAFSSWLAENYDATWELTSLVRRGFGIHNGRLHRSLSQIQIKLFEDCDGLKNIVSTSSIIEGVNTSAENVIIWRNRNGQTKLTDFAYRNIIGRGGRMFKHFIGQIYILEPPPDASNATLQLEFPEQLVGEPVEMDARMALDPERVARILAYKEEMGALLGPDSFKQIQSDKSLASSDWFQVRDMAASLKNTPERWNGVGYLNSNDVSNWDRFLYNALALDPGGCGIEYNRFVGFVKILAKNWTSSIPDLLNDLDRYDIGIDKFFELERYATMKFAMLLGDINTLHKHINPGGPDISPFVTKISNAFLPATAYDLEEYGLPRMITKKLHLAGFIDVEADDMNIHRAIDILKRIGLPRLLSDIHSLSDFDKYILEYFFDGITTEVTA